MRKNEKAVNLPSDSLVIPPDNEIQFFDRDQNSFGFLSNFYPAIICLDDEKWFSVEHYYQARKSDDEGFRFAVKSESTPGKAKKMASVLLRGNPKLLRPNWGQVKVDVMKQGLHAKFQQHSDLRINLLSTGSAILIEDAEHDSFWGRSSHGIGENNLGLLLMQLRDELRSKFE